MIKECGCGNPHPLVGYLCHIHQYKKDFGDNKPCICGHSYYRHFDSYDNMIHIGCKYCQCFEFELQDTTMIERADLDTKINIVDTATEDEGIPKEVMETSKVAVRFDKGKAPWRLFMWDAAHEVVKVLGMGAEKYSERNWEKGMKYSRCYDSAQRHLYAWFQKGEDTDQESGLNHLAHAAWNILVLLAYQLRGHTQNDDRPRITNKN